MARITGKKGKNGMLADAMVRPLLPASVASAFRVLSADLSPRERLAVSSRSIRNFFDLSRSLPPEPTLGASVMVRFAASTASTYRALLARGFSEKEAEKKTAEINWEVYRHMAGAYFQPACAGRGRSPVRRVARTMERLMRFPYAHPGYDMRWRVKSGEEASFDVRRCPASDFFRSRGLASLGKIAFCDLDYPLAHVWGVCLDRKDTLMGGASLCNFRFFSPDSDSIS